MNDLSRNIDSEAMWLHYTQTQLTDMVGKPVSDQDQRLDRTTFLWLWNGLNSDDQAYWKNKIIQERRINWTKDMINYADSFMDQVIDGASGGELGKGFLDKINSDRKTRDKGVG